MLNLYFRNINSENCLCTKAWFSECIEFSLTAIKSLLHNNLWHLVKDSQLHKYKMENTMLGWSFTEKKTQGIPKDYKTCIRYMCLPSINSARLLS